MPSRTNKDRWPVWAQIALAFMVLLILGLLLVLPLLSATYIGRQGGDTVGSEIWVPMIATLIGLTTMTVSGVFIFMTFRIDRGVKLTAADTAEKTAIEFLENDTEISELRSQVKQSARQAKEYVRSVQKDLGETKAESVAQIDSKVNDVNEHAMDAKGRIRSQINDVERSAEQFLAHCETLVQSAVDDRVTPQLVEPILNDLLKADAYGSLTVEIVRRFASEAEPRVAQEFVRELIGGLRELKAEIRRREKAEVGWRRFLRRFRSDKR